MVKGSLSLLDPIVAARFGEYLSTTGSPLVHPTGAGEASFALPGLDLHHERDEYPPGRLQMSLTGETVLVQAPVRHPSSFMDCLSSLIEPRVYHKTNVILTSYS